MTTKINVTTSGITESVDTSGVLEFQTGGGSALIINTDQSANFTGTTALTVPNGTTAQRPTPVNGMMRYNTSLSIFEVYANNSWSAANVTPTPVNTVAPVISGSAIVGQNLTCTTGTWSGSPSAYYYQWRANATAIGGATANVFTLTLAENGANITCNVTAYNVAGNSSPATSNTLGPVIQGVTVNYLVVAGGGSGGGGGGFTNFGVGGGGAGGLLTGTTILQPANTYAITIGAGGAATPSSATVGYNGTQGANTTAFGLTAVGGGYGAGAEFGGLNGGAGGSGGGALGYNTSATGGAGTAGQGYAGGNAGNGSSYGGGGGGGAGQAGISTVTNNSGAGGNGVSSSISGTATYYAGGGGGGGGGIAVAAAGGLGGGGAGGAYQTNGTRGTANLGAGGGASGTSAGAVAVTSGAGGSGIVIISYAGAQQFGGGVVSSAGGNTIHTFYTSGSLVPLTSLSASYLVVAGGAGGGHSAGGGGGGGGVLSGSNVTIDTSSTYVITVGSGGAGGLSAAVAGGNGANSTFSALANAAIGGGGGGGNGYPSSSANSFGLNGGSGGGSGWNNSGAGNGAGTSGQGYAGGITTASNSDTNYSTGGGGGGGQVGFNGTGAGGVGGKGGNGAVSSISGVATYYAGGGGGVGTSSNGAGGLGGGGTGSGSGTATAGTANTGGGGGGGGNGGNGGSGIVYVSYPGSTPMMAGGNVTVVSNTVVHTFTSSGYLTPFVNFNNSLRFRSSASAYLSKTYTTAPTSRTTMTMSFWMKVGKQDNGTSIFALTGTGNNYETIQYVSPSNGNGWPPNSIRVTGPYASGQQGAIVTNAVYRDPAAWYHIVVVYDTTNATAADRIRLYVNGSRVTSFYSSTDSNQNNTTTEWLVSGQLSSIGITGGSTTQTFDGYMTEINVIDGQALSPYAFGTFNQYGVWAPVRYAGSYGNNGFYLPFSGLTSTYTGLFNGSSYWASVPDNAAFTLGTNDFTVEAWINSSTYAGDNQFIIDQWNSSSYGWAFSVNSATNIRFEYFTGGSYVNRNYTCPTLQANVWYHIAWVRKSGTTTVYLNGTAIGTSSDNVSIDNSSYQVAIGRNNDGGGSYVKNYLSNLRFVNGSAVYSSNFNPPTSPLTAVTNTQLLTLQSSTLVDNSPNAFTITNNGILMAQAMPFIQQVATDYSPQGNNWTPNNFGAQQTYNIDSMVDVPTLTSANVANYAVLNPLNMRGSCTLSNGNLQGNIPSGTGGNGTLTATIAVSSGKFYWEVTGVSSAYYADIGLIATTISAASMNTRSTGGVGYSYYDGSKYVDGTNSAYGASFTYTDTIGVALDMDGGTVTFYKNNTSQGAITLPAGYTTWFPAVTTDTSGAAMDVVFNFGQRPFTYTPPAGYLPLNTYNM